MRIRKYAKVAAAAAPSAQLPPPSFSGVSDALVCQLNRSPWDVISFGTQSRGPKEIKEEEGEEEREEKMAENGRISSPNIKLLEVEEGKDENHEKEKILCRKTGSKGWKCRNEAKQGHTLCEHHLALRQYYRHGRKPDAATGKCRRIRDKKPPSSSSSDFYFYSGFGPRWRKRRKTSESEDDAPMPQPPPPLSSPPSYMDPHEHADLDNDDHDDDDEDDDEEEELNCKKRRRKPRKARSLKSLL